MKNTKTDDTDGSCLSTASNKIQSNVKSNNNNQTTIAISKIITKSDLKSWTVPQLLAEIQKLDFQTSQNIIQLFNDDNTIPFICRYRKELIGDMTPDM